MKVKELLKNKSVLKKIAIGITVSMLLIGATVFKTQSDKINQLEKDLYIQQNTTEQKYGYTETQINTKTIEVKFNTLKSYKIFSDKVNIKHSYSCSNDKILGLKAKSKLTGSADFYYEYNVDLSSYEIMSATDSLIKISIDKPMLSKDSCHRVVDTFYKIEDECSDSMLSNKNDREKLTRQWEDTFDKKGFEYIKDYYSMDNKVKELDNYTKQEVTELLRSLGYTQTIKIYFK